MQTVICMKWGTRYESDYVNRLHSMVMRHVERPTRLICFTDNDDGLNPNITAHPLPPITLPKKWRWLPWRKISLWQAPLADLEGDVLFLDLDVVVTASLDPFFDVAPGKYCVIENWTQIGQNIGNTSVYRFPVGQYTYIYERLMAEPETYLNRYRASQQYISGEIEEQVFWPTEWCVSFKHSLMPPWPLNFFQTPRLPPSAKVVCFTGKPDPDEAMIGRWPTKRWDQALYKHVRPTPWIDKHWK